MTRKFTIWDRDGGLNLFPALGCAFIVPFIITLAVGLSLLGFSIAWNIVEYLFKLVFG